MIVTFLDAVLFTTYFLLLFLSIFWLLVLFSSNEEEDKRRKKNNKLKKHPFFTAIVPAFNEEKSIKETLISLLNLDYPKNKIEIIIVNDGSTDRTKEIVEDVIKSNPSREIILINQKNKGKGRAMNKGLRKARGEFFACLDADSFVAPDALKVMLPMFESDEKVGAVCPLLKVKGPRSILQKV